MSDTKIYLGIEVGDASLKVALLDSAEKRVLRTAILQTGTSPLDDVYTFETVLQAWLESVQQESVEAVSLSIPAFRSVIRQVFVPAGMVPRAYYQCRKGLLHYGLPGPLR